MKSCVKFFPTEIILNQAVLRNATEFQHSYFSRTKKKGTIPVLSAALWGKAPAPLS